MTPGRESPAEMSPADTSDSPPVIVIFGAAVRPGGVPSQALRRRVAAALAAGAADPRTLYIPTGAVGRHPPAEAAVMATLLRQSGIPPARILLELTGTDTLSSVRAVRHQLLTLGRTGAVRVATSGYHLPRCLLLMRLAGLHATACPPPPGPAARRWYKRWRWRLREIPALPWDAALVLLLRALGRL